MNTETIPIQRTGGHLRVGILGVALGVVLGVTGTALAIDSYTSTTPAAVVREDSSPARSVHATDCRTMTADGTERCLAAASTTPAAVVREDDTAERWTQMTSRPTADAPSLHALSADTAERSAQAQAAIMSGDPFVSADAAERSAQAQAAIMSGDPFVSADTAERSADASGS